jgi:hypothetical protein
MARNLSERLLDMVENDARFIGLTASQVLAWLKIIRLIDRNATRRDVAHAASTCWDEMRLHLHVSNDRLLTLMDIFQARGLLRYVSGFFLVPDEVLPVMNARPHMKRIRERNRQEEEEFWRSDEGRKVLASDAGDS